MILKKIRAVNKEKEEKEKRFFKIVFGTLALILLVWLVKMNIMAYKEIKKLKIDTEKAANELDAQKQKKEELEKAVLETKEPSYQEEKIREEGYRKPNEKEIVIIEKNKTAEEKEREKTWWQKFFERLGY